MRPLFDLLWCLSLCVEFKKQTKTKTCCVFLCIFPSNLLCMCLLVYLHIQKQQSVHGFIEEDILHRSKMREPLWLCPPTFTPPPSVYPLGSLVFLPANHYCYCHLLYFMCLVYSSLSAPNTSVCVSFLFYLQMPPCHHKKVRQLSIRHLWILIHFHTDAVLVPPSLHIFAHSQIFANAMKKKIMVLLTLI